MRRFAHRTTVTSRFMSTINLYYPSKSVYNLKTLLITEQSGSPFIKILTLNQPRQLNPLSLLCVTELLFAFEHFERDETTRVVILTGAGTRAFSCGASVDMLQMLSKGSQVSENDYKRLLGEEVYISAKAYEQVGKGNDSKDFPDIALMGLTRRILNFKKFLVVALNGLAVGGSVNIAFLADFIFCCKDQEFYYPFNRLGVPPELGSSILVPARLGMVKARRFLMLGERFNVKEVPELVHCVVEDQDEVMKEALKFSEKYLISDNQYEGKLLVKRAVNEGVLKQIDGQIEMENKLFKESIKGEFFKKSVKQMLSKI
jgi:enoyl-CoA hydratase